MTILTFLARTLTDGENLLALPCIVAIVLLTSFRGSFDRSTTLRVVTLRTTGRILLLARLMPQLTPTAMNESLFPWLPIDTIRKTCQKTTQYACMPLNTWLKKRFHTHFRGDALRFRTHEPDCTPIDWHSKKQSTVETHSYASELVASRTFAERNIALRITLRYLGVPIHEAIAGDLIQFYHMDGRTILQTSSASIGTTHTPTLTYSLFYFGKVIPLTVRLLWGRINPNKLRLLFLIRGIFIHRRGIFMHHSTLPLRSSGGPSHVTHSA